MDHHLWIWMFMNVYACETFYIIFAPTSVPSFALSGIDYAKKTM